ncbi:hypothetical protein Lal_00041735 [Lupinus albus]|nr:hypothetical protein Lal_00041735 [Lupinus albus]
MGNMEELEKDLLDTFRNVEVNIPLLDAIKKISRYAKFLKELCTHKRKLKDLTLSLKRGISHSSEATLAQARILQTRQFLNATFLAQERQLSPRRDHSRSSETILAQGVKEPKLATSLEPKLATSLQRKLATLLEPKFAT